MRLNRSNWGKQDIVFAGGGGLCWEMACGSTRWGIVRKYNDTPEKASRTYDAHRDGFLSSQAVAV